MDERSYWLGFSVFPGIGPKRFALLLQAFGSAKVAWEASDNELEKVIGKALTEQFGLFRKTFNPKAYLIKLKERGVEFVILDDETYPQLLKQISNPPFVLFVKGSLRFDDSNHSNTIAIVGTRKITSYGREVTERITRELVSAGYIIVSGLAIGVDAVAHSETLSDNGKTIAVLGCGVDCCTPRENSGLYNRIIASGGCIVSEYPLSAEPTKGSFPSRNRIIAGLSQAVIVTEGAEDSGALYTASNAFLENRPVFAVPGPITSQLSKGPNGLIVKGAKMVMGIEDILKELGAKNIKNIKSIKGDNAQEQLIIDLLKNEQLHFDELLKRTGIDSARAGILLSMMEMKGMVRSLEGGLFTLGV